MYPKPLHPSNAKLIKSPTNKPNHVSKIKLSIKSNYPFVINTVNKPQTKSPTSKGRKVLKNLSTNIIKN